MQIGRDLIEHRLFRLAPVDLQVRARCGPAGKVTVAPVTEPGVIVRGLEEAGQEVMRRRAASVAVGVVFHSWALIAAASSAVISASRVGSVMAHSACGRRRPRDGFVGFGWRSSPYRNFQSLLKRRAMAHERPRHLRSVLQHLATLSPLVGLIGHRQVGRLPCLRRSPSIYVTFDDEDVLSSANANPKAFVASLRFLSTAIHATSS